MQIDGTLRKIIPICSLIIALGTVAFQTIENEEKKVELIKKEKIQKSKDKTDGDKAMQTL